MVARQRKILIALLCTVFCITLAAICVVLLILPLPDARSADNERYVCIWENGTVTEEGYAQAYAALDRADEGNIFLSRDGIQGKITAGTEYGRIFGILQNGSLAELLALQKGDVSRLEQAALWRTFSGVLWYSDEAFAWDGERVVRSDRGSASALVLLSGRFPNGFVKQSGAEALCIRSGAAISPADLSGTAVCELTAEAPYTVSGGALYLDTAGGKRLIAALPTVGRLELDSDLSYVDEGALSPCARLQTLIVPFVGSAKNTSGTAYDPCFGRLFGTDGSGRYAVPEMLKRVAITGGSVQSRAFYGCVFLEEIDASGAESVAEDAFSDCRSLRYLRTAFPVRLTGNFSVESEGIYTVYTRV